ncbi:MAG: hypothetical protein AAF467_18025 [Actinomycetota bacterium]
MGVFHRATLTPTKAQLIADWLPTTAWGPGPNAEVSVVGAFRFDDPENKVGIETHLVEADGTLYQVPVTYREEPAPEAADAFIAEMEHSALGTRWVYDGVGDPRYVMMLAGVTMTGQGEALGVAEVGGRWYVSPVGVRINGGGWGLEPVAVDQFQTDASAGDVVEWTNDRFHLRFHRRPVAAPRPAIALTATWDAQTEPVVLAEVSEQ